MFVGQVAVCVEGKRPQTGEDFQVVAPAGLCQVGGGAFYLGQGQGIAGGSRCGRGFHT